MEQPAAARRRAAWRALAVLCLALVILAIDVTVVNLAVPHLERTLAPSHAELLWIIDIYAFAMAALLIIMGNLGDKFGLKQVLLVGATVFGLASIGAAHAPNALLLILCRCGQGAAAATLMPSTLGLIRHLFTDPRERQKAIAIWMAVYSAGAAAGPLVGAFLLAHFGWHAIFYANVPVCLAIVGLGVLFIPNIAPQQTATFDVKGALLAAICMFATTYGLKILALHGFAITAVIAVLVGLGAGILLAVTLKHNPDGIIDITLLKNRVFSTTVLVNAVAMFLYLGGLFVLSSFLQQQLGLSELRAAQTLVPGLIVSAVMAVAIGYVSISARRVIATGFGAAALGLVLLALATRLDHPAWWLLAGGYVVVCGAAAIIDPVSNDIIVAAAPPERAGAAASLSETGYEVGAALGTAVLGGVMLTTSAAAALGVAAALALLMMVIVLVNLRDHGKGAAKQRLGVAQ